MCAQPRSHARLCDPVDCSPPDSSVRGDSPGRNPEVGCHLPSPSQYASVSNLQICSIHSPLNRHLGCYSSLATVNMGLEMSVCWRSCFHFLWISAQNQACWTFPIIFKDGETEAQRRKKHTQRMRRRHCAGGRKTCVKFQGCAGARECMLRLCLLVISGLSVHWKDWC